MDFIQVVALLTLCALSVWITWWSISDQAMMRKRARARNKKHLRVVRHNEDKRIL